MKLLTATLVIVLLTTASAKPVGWRQHNDADITDKDWKHYYYNWWWFTESSGLEDSSSESDQSSESWESSESSESRSSEESSEEILITDQTTPVMTTITTGVPSTLTPEPGTVSTRKPTVTPPPATPVVTSPDNVTSEETPTPAPITENRGDN